MSQIRELDAGTRITLYADNGISENFKIEQNIDRGASAICYYAYAENADRPGILKEYCPEKSESLIRDDNGYLIHKQGMDNEKERFYSEMNRYIEYHNNILHEIRNNSDFSTFFQEPVFYYSAGANVTDRTVYTWTKDPQLITFKELCNDIRKSANNAEQNLRDILEAVRSLTDCIRILHKSGFIHRDIKPSNFGFITRDNKPLYQNIKFFDVDTVCSVFDAYELPPVGSIGFHEPFTGQPENNQTDIYSIGATLFYALIFTDETIESGYCYNDDLYDDIDELIKESLIIKSVSNNTDIPETYTDELIENLISILKKSLCERRNRYNSCEELKRDIDTVFEAVCYIISNLSNNETYDIYNGINENEFIVKSYLNDIEISQIKTLIKKYEKSDEVCSNAKEALILGLAYYYGYQTDKNIEKGVCYIIKSADLGNTCAENLCLYLALYSKLKLNEFNQIIINEVISKKCIMTLHKYGTELIKQKNKEGIGYINKAAESGNINSMFFLSNFFINNNSSGFPPLYQYKFTDEELNKIETLILGYVLKCYARGILIFKKLYADMLKNGYYYPQNYELAIVQYDVLLSENYKQVYFDLYNCCISAQRYTDALNYLEKAAHDKKADKAIVIKALTLLSTHYYNGNIVPRDLVKAAKYYLKTLEVDPLLKNNPFTVQKVIDLCDYANPKEKKELLTKALKLGCINVSLHLAKIEMSESHELSYDTFHELCFNTNTENEDYLKIMVYATHNQKFINRIKYDDNIHEKSVYYKPDNVNKLIDFIIEFKSRIIKEKKLTADFFWNYGNEYSAGKLFPKDEIKASYYRLKSVIMDKRYCTNIHIVNGITQIEDKKTKNKLLKKAAKLRCTGVFLTSIEELQKISTINNTPASIKSHKNSNFKFNNETGELIIYGILSYHNSVFYELNKNMVKRITALSGTILNGNCSEVFREYINCTEIDLSNTDTSDVTSLNSLFKGCSSLTSINLSSFNINNTVSLRGIFSDCPLLNKITLSSSFKKVDTYFLLINGKGWANSKDPETVISDSKKYAEFENDGLNIYIRLPDDDTEG